MIAISFTRAAVAALLPLSTLAGVLGQGYISGNSGPSCVIGPKQPFKPFPISYPRTRTCVVKANRDGSDDSQNILNALHECNNGGHVIFSKNEKYIIGTALDMTFLNRIDLGNCKDLPFVFLVFLANRSARHPRLHPIHQRHHVLASTRLLPNVSERNNVLPARWN